MIETKTTNYLPGNLRAWRAELAAGWLPLDRIVLAKGWWLVLWGRRA